MLAHGLCDTVLGGSALKKPVPLLLRAEGVQPFMPCASLRPNEQVGEGMASKPLGLRVALCRSRLCPKDTNPLVGKEG